MTDVVISDYDVITAFGKGIKSLWNGVKSGESKIHPISRFPVNSYPSKIGAFINGLDTNHSDSLLMQLLQQFVFKEKSFPSYPVLFATAKGEIDLLEKHKEYQTRFPPYHPNDTLERIKKAFNFTKKPILISAACASGTLALATAARMIRSGSTPGVLVIGADVITSFTFSGFNALLALDQKPAAPFDKNRKGLSLGDGASWILLLSRDEAVKQKKEIFGTIEGFGTSNDANHATGPSRTGDGLATAVRQAITVSGKKETNIGVICGHGTGTIYNDLMEIKAFQSVFTSPRPVFSIKGAMGHSMGACGIIEALVTLKTLEEQRTPPNVNLVEPEELMKSFVTKKQQSFSSTMALTTNSGFGGINAALILKKEGKYHAPLY